MESIYDSVPYHSNLSIRSSADLDESGHALYASLNDYSQYSSQLRSNEPALPHQLFQSAQYDPPSVSAAPQLSAMSYPPNGGFGPPGAPYNLKQHNNHATNKFGQPGYPPAQTVLPSQNAGPVTCLACGKIDCTLSSHKYFTKNVTKTKPTETTKPQVRVHVRARSNTSPVSSPEAFNQYPMIMDAERQHLLSLWSREWSAVKLGPERHLFPVRFLDRILPVAQTHAPLLQAMFALSATLWALANNVVSDVASRNLNYAVQMLSQACPSEQEASTDEAMLAAILILLVYMALGNGVEVGKHVSGLNHLVKRRGGPHYLGLSGLLAEMLLYADHMQAVFLDREPDWKMPLPPLSLGQAARQGKGFQLAVATHNMDAAVGMAGESVAKLADVFELHDRQQFIPSEVLNCFGYLSTMAEYQIAACNAVYHGSAGRNECICLALVLFNAVVLRNDGAMTPLIRKTEFQFWTSFEAAEANGQFVDMTPSLYLWMLITALTTVLRGESQWRLAAVDRMRVAIRAAVITSWDQFRSLVLDEFTWLASMQEQCFRRIWLEVEGLKTMKLGST